MVGTTISHYKVLEKIGEGGMGEVFLAQDTTLDRKVTLKFLPEKYPENKQALEPGILLDINEELVIIIALFLLIGDRLDQAWPMSVLVTARTSTYPFRSLSNPAGGAKGINPILSKGCDIAALTPARVRAASYI